MRTEMIRTAVTLLTLMAIAIAACRRSPEPAETVALPYEKVSAKPGSPVAVDLWFETPPVAGAKARIWARAVSSVDGREMSVAVNLPNGIRKTGGTDTLRCAPRKDAKEELAIECLIPEGECCEITATVTLILPDGTKFANACALVVGKRRDLPDTRGKPSANSQGEKIIEFPAR